MAPKARSKFQEKKIQPSSSVDRSEGNVDSLSKSGKNIYTAINRVIPCHYFSLPSINENVAWVSPSTFCHLFSSANEQPIVSNLRGYVTYDRLTPPTEPTTTQALNNQSAIQPQPEPKILLGSSHSMTNGASSYTELQKDDSLLLICSSEIPRLHIVVLGTNLDIQDWDLIR